MKPAPFHAATMLRRFAACACAFACAAPQAREIDAADRLARMSIEQLQDLEVTTVAGIAQRQIEAPAAMYVITADEIRRSGHRSIAEALRLVPGMYVGRASASSWVVGARGLAGSILTATRYLVMVDGRVVHDPLLSTTFWDAVDVVVEDIDRIEVIRGPGATLWGVNAMNGVVSVITKPASATRGTLAVAGAGTEERVFATLRRGGAVGDGNYRVWSKYAQHDDFETGDGRSVVDRWSELRGGFRVDLPRDDGSRLTVSGDAYSHPVAMVSVQLPVPGRHDTFEQRTGDGDVRGSHLLARLAGGEGQATGWSVQAYVDRTERAFPRLAFERDVLDVDLRRWHGWGDGRQQLIWGLQYTEYDDAIEPGTVVQFADGGRRWSAANAFVQNTTELAPERWYATFGTKLTDHDFTGFALQPNARLWWTPSGEQTWWASVSRPVRVPSRLEEDGALVLGYVDTGLASGRPATGTIVPLMLRGNDALRVEEMLAYEVGHRYHIGTYWAFDTTAFVNDYDDLVSVPPATVGTVSSAGSGRTRGIEAALSWRPMNEWRIEAAFSMLDTEIDGPVRQSDEIGTPETLAQVRSYVDFTPALELNAAIYHVGRIPRLDIDAYQRVDMGVTWRPRPDVRLSLWGQNLTDAGHPEASDADVPRGVYAQIAFDLTQ